LIAQEHAHPRDASRLLVLRGDALSHGTFRELPQLLRPGDLLVLNDTRVLAARLFGQRRGGAMVELLLLRPAAQVAYDPHATRWLALAKPGRGAPLGESIAFGDLGYASIEAVHPDGTRELELHLDGTLQELLKRSGRLPLPPYVRNDSAQAQADYQTVFAAKPGSVAAPTAALHFTPETLAELKERGVQMCAVTLEIGLATFRPIRTRLIEEHDMHAEAFEIPAAAAQSVAAAKAEGRRVVAAGTTVVRALEAAALESGLPRAGRSQTKLFIKPGFEFRVVDAMLTNFHLPQSTLLVLVSAFAGRDRILRAYEEAVGRRYRFFSFGDAMLIEP
jgi:S-adenosylmethionine:tRNA ribosyltransferase-isomerase